MPNQAKVNALREALKAIRHEAQEALHGSDRNPNRADLMRLDRLAAQALEETK